MLVCLQTVWLLQPNGLSDPDLASVEDHLYPCVLGGETSRGSFTSFSEGEYL